MMKTTMSKVQTKPVGNLQSSGGSINHIFAGAKPGGKSAAGHKKMLPGRPAGRVSGHKAAKGGAGIPSD